MSGDLNAFLAGMLFEKLNRLLRVVGNSWNSGDDFTLGIHLPERSTIDVGLIEQSFYNVFELFNIHNLYTVEIRCELNPYDHLKATVKLFNKEEETS